MSRKALDWIQFTPASGHGKGVQTIYACGCKHELVSVSNGDGSYMIVEQGWNSCLLHSSELYWTLAIVASWLLAIVLSRC